MTMASKDFGQLPGQAKIRPQAYQVKIPEKKLQLLKNLVSLSPIGPITYENTTTDEDYGISRAWLTHAKHVWETEFDWRKTEERLNTFPHFTISIDDTQDGGLGQQVTVHFVALFSKNPNAIPLAMYHGWPGSFMEHLEALTMLMKGYDPETLPYHIVVPSFTGFMFSSGPPVDKDFTVSDQARILNTLMSGLFPDTGYLAHGGDMGGPVALTQAVTYEACKGVHVNNALMGPPDNAASLPLSDLEKSVMGKMQQFMSTGIAYAMEQGTRPGTIGLALSASPLALLAWIGEKYIAWSDETPPLQHILEVVSLYYLTDTYPRSIWHYRSFIQKGATKWPQIPKPVGYSFFSHDVVPVPASWIKTFANVVFHHQHEHGGHFPGIEKPRELLRDIEEYIKIAWK